MTRRRPAPGSPPPVADDDSGAKSPSPAPVRGSGIREFIVFDRQRPAGFFDDPHFTAGLVVFGGATVFFGIIWMYRYVTHDPLADTGTGTEILGLLLLIAGLVLVRELVLRWGRS